MRSELPDEATPSATPTEQTVTTGGVPVVIFMPGIVNFLEPQVLSGVMEFLLETEISQVQPFFNISTQVNSQNNRQDQAKILKIAKNWLDLDGLRLIRMTIVRIF